MIQAFILGCILLCTLQGCSQPIPKAATLKTETTDSVVMLSEAEWKTRLSPEQYYILRQKGTEQAFTGKFTFTKDKGVYKCAGCGQELFTDDMKFESHCGWPSFDREIKGGRIIQTEDYSHGMHRTEITCARCGGHLGHIFDDGPTATGQRYCVNSASLLFEPAALQTENTLDTITLAGGCFWCIEAVFDELKGVKDATSGYSGGLVANPTYKEVCTGNTGHAEAVQVVFNPKEITLEKILEVFFTVHNPTTLNRQGADVGTQYRSAIFYRNKQQEETVKHIIATLNKEQVFDQPIVTEVSPYLTFYDAENYHQEYYALNNREPYCQMVIKPKLDKFHKSYQQFLKK